MQPVKRFAARYVGMSAQQNRAPFELGNGRNFGKAVPVTDEDVQTVSVYPGAFGNGEGQESEIDLGIDLLGAVPGPI